MVNWLKKISLLFSNKKQDNDHCIAEFSIAGLQHYRGDDLAEMISVGDNLNLQLEPHNAYDPNAIIVMWHHNKIGYVPASFSKNIYQQIENGVEIIATIIEVEPIRFGRKWIKVRLVANK